MIKFDNQEISKNIDLSDWDCPLSEYGLQHFLGYKRIKGTRYDFFNEKTAYGHRIAVYLSKPNEDNEHECVCDMPLKRVIVGGMHCYHPEYTRIHHTFQGQGLGMHFYLAVSKFLNIKIRSGKSQSPGSVKLWYNLCRSKDTMMYIYSRRLGWLEAYLDDKNKEIMNDEIDVYDVDTACAVFATV